VLYGRHAERAQIGALLEAARESRSGAIVVRGEPGIGKTALLEDARERAADMHVLSARGVQSEADLPFAGLHQLIRPALHLIEALPAPQAEALKGALGLVDRPGDERFLIAAACLTLLSELAESRPVLCVIDDAQWLDSSSADALLFAARRLGAEGIVMLFAARDDTGAEFHAADLESLAMKELDADAAGLLLSQVVADAAPAVREHLIQKTRGNALALVELASALTPAQLTGNEALPDVLPLTEEVERIFLGRVRQLPDETQRALLLAAADGGEDAGLVIRAAEALGMTQDPLGAAEAIRLITVQDQRLEFRHPLVRSAVYGAATSSERREAHGALAAALLGQDDDADRRAWHLAASVLDGDESVVPALDEAAERAQRRGGYLAAAKAYIRAGELCSDGAARGSRLVRAASALSLAGSDARAVEVATQAAAFVHDPLLRAELAHVHGLAAVRRGRPEDVVHTMVEAARAVAPVRPAKAIELLVDATVAAWQGGDQTGYLDIARLAETVVPPADDEAARVIARSLGGFAAMLSGDTSTGVAVLGELVAWGERAESAPHAVWASFGALWLGEEGRFGLLLARAISLARERGELGTLAEALGIRASQFAISQRLDEAAIAATEAVQLAHELEAENLEFLPLGALTIVSAARGRDEEARQHAERVLERAPAKGLRLRMSPAIWGLALADMGRARWAEAFERLDGLDDPLDPATALTIPDKIEAAVRAGRPEAAQAALPAYEAWAAYSGAPAVRSRLAACRALVSRGDEATRHFEEAMDDLAGALPLDRARIHLLFGEHLRRERRRVDARTHLRAAIDAFESLRATAWADRARAELRASGEVARKRDPSTIDDLTPQEVQIARFVADGLSNKEVAAQLFLSPRTIDYHLRNVFAKLGIRSRTQLARLSLGGDEAVGDLAATAST
jgi:DNA-binding CsgD family transcriptional regulator/tetratricopeptide (TPR) repeat protein